MFPQENFLSWEDKIARSKDGKSTTGIKLTENYLMKSY